MAGLEPIKDIAKRLYPELKTAPLNSKQGGSDVETFTCSICKDAHMVHPMNATTGRPDYSNVVACPCVRDQWAKEHSERYRKFCRLPEGHPGWTFENFTAYTPSLQEAKEAAMELAENTGKVKWLTLTGDVDRGKSHLAVAVCRRWLDRGELARYGYVTDLLNELKSTFDKTEEWTFKAMFDAICNVPLLVLDELGVEKPTPWAMEQLNTIINHRYLEGLPLMVTTNLAGAEMEPRIASRLKRFEPGRVVVIKAEEYRLWKTHHAQKEK